MSKIIVNCETGEILERALTDDEIAQQIADEKELEAEAKIIEAEAAAKEAARQSILDRLGLSADEAKILLG
jgi:hypothetical protein